MSEARLHHHLQAKETHVESMVRCTPVQPTQSTAPGRVMSVARKTMSSPCSVVIDLCASQRCCMTFSRLPCHLHDAPGQGHMYLRGENTIVVDDDDLRRADRRLTGRKSQHSSWSSFVLCARLNEQPLVWYLQGNCIVSATFSMPKLRMLPRMDATWSRSTGIRPTYPTVHGMLDTTRVSVGTESRQCVPVDIGVSAEGRSRSTPDIRID